jgi:hypothetical protein
MPESTRHAELVQLLITCITSRHRANLGLCVYADTPEARPGDKPRPINGFVPDVLAVTVPRTFTIIGEAKTFTDLTTARSRSQIQAFLQFLRYSREASMMLAVPPAAHALAHNLLETARRRSVAPNVGIEIITPANSVACQ